MFTLAIMKRCSQGLIIGFALFFFKTSFGAESIWLCSEESSQRRGSSIYSCGVGTGADENRARRRAFDNAQAEFSKICNASDDCRDHEVTVDPKRTSCSQGGVGEFKCYRLVVFSVGSTRDTKSTHDSKSEPIAENSDHSQSVSSRMEPSTALGICIPRAANPENPADYLLAMIEAFSATRDGSRLSSIAAKAKPQQVILLFSKAQQAYRCAISHITSYQASQSHEIAQSSEGLKSSLETFIALLDFEIEIYEKALNGQITQPGTLAKDSAQISIHFNEAWEKFSVSAALSAYAVLDNAHWGYILISRAERRAAIRMLREKFPQEKKTKGFAELAGSNLLGFLTQGWKTKS